MDCATVKAGSAMSLTPELVVEAMAEVGESPIWDERRASLWWVDIYRCQLMEWSPNAGLRCAASLDQCLGFVVPMESGAWLAGVRDGFGVIDGHGRFELTVPVDRDKPEYRMNDGKADALGRVWAGTVSDANPTEGYLYRLDASNHVVRIRDDVQYPNGIAWTRDGSRMYLVDSEARAINIWNVVDGELEHLAGRLQVRPSEGIPDGITIDAEGGLWVALFGGSAVVRYGPSGEVDRRVELPVPNPTGVTFGGKDLEDLYITTARYGVKETMLASYPRGCGGIFRIRPGVRGLQTHLWAGRDGISVNRQDAGTSIHSLEGGTQ
jgi:sugar lactone lactonase YvrE